VLDERGEVALQKRMPNEPEIRRLEKEIAIKENF